MQPIKQDDFYDFDYLSNISYSPKGDKAIVVNTKVDIKNNGYKQYLYLYVNNKFRKLTKDGKGSLYIWKNNDEILYFSTVDKKDIKRKKNGEIFTCIYIININKKQIKKIKEIPLQVVRIKKIDEENYIISSSIDVNNPDYYKLERKKQKEIEKQHISDKDYEVCDEIPFWFNGEGFINKQRTALFTYNLKNNKLQRFTKPEFNLYCFDILNNKVIYAGETIKNKSNEYCGLYEYSLISNKTKTIIKERKNFDIYNMASVSDGVILQVCEKKKYGGNENCVLYTYRKNKIQSLFKKDLTYGNSTGSDSRLGGGKTFVTHNDKLYFVETRRNAAVLSSVSLDGKQEDIFSEEGSIEFFDINKDGQIIACYMNATKLQDIYQINNSKLKRISNFNVKKLNNKYVALPEKLNIKSGDTDIDGWILKPINYNPKKKYPCVLDIHGGPKTVYGEIYYHEMQIWASKGYFVCFCNPTGSDGRGNKFSDIRGKYGTVDYRNIMDFLDEVLSKNKAIDHKKLCVTGGSYGGFMTNWIVGHTNKFACAATQRSISNWISFEGVSDIGPTFTYDQQAANRKKDFNKIWWHSPLKYVDNVKTPILFIHSDEDYRCPLEQGIQFYSAIKNNNIESRMVIFHGENHELSRGGKPKHRSRRLKEITDWFESNVK